MRTHPRLIVVFFLVCLLRVAELTLAAPVTLGYELGDGNRVSIVFPLAVSQCEPVVIFFSITTGDQILLNLYPPDESLPFLTLTFPNGTGYLSWNCIVPAGSSFITSADDEHLFTVQPGPSSACLGDLSVNASVGRYATNDYSSFTQMVYTAGFIGPFQATLNSYESTSLKTITANPLSEVQATSSSVPTPTAPSSSLSQGYQLGDPSRGINILFPLIVAECEPVEIFYNITIGDQVGVNLYPPDDSLPFLVFTFPTGVGYMEWICDIPAKTSFIASALDEHLYTVQSGSSSACLGEPIANTAVARYATNIFHSFTQGVYTAGAINPDQATLDGFIPTSLPTLTANSFSGEPLPSSASSSSSSPIPSGPPSKSRKISSGAIAGITVGAVAAVAFLAFMCWRCIHIIGLVANNAPKPNGQILLQPIDGQPNARAVLSQVQNVQAVPTPGLPPSPPQPHAPAGLVQNGLAGPSGQQGASRVQPTPELSITDYPPSGVASTSRSPCPRCGGLSYCDDDYSVACTSHHCHHCNGTTSSLFDDAKDGGHQ